MNIFFDMDYTLLAVDGSLRPGARELMERLIVGGNAVYVWSGDGIRWLEVRRHGLETLVADCFHKWLEVRRHGLETLVADCFHKPMDNYRAAVQDADRPVKPDLVVDDHLEVAAALGGVWVRPYYFASETDDEMERVGRIIGEWIEHGHSDDPRFRKPPHV